ncbi:MAG: hypothetical protein WKF86_02345 [Acidimicrobiales bacterium]
MVPRAWASRTGRRTVAGFYVGLPLSSLLLLRQPLLTTAVVAVEWLAVLVIVSPEVFISGAAFFCTAVPKAGFIVAGLPLPLMMFVLLLSAAVLRVLAGSGNNSGSRLLVLALGWLGYRLAALHLNGGTTIDLAALAGWYGLPLALLIAGPAIGSLAGRISRSWSRCLENGILFACGFSLVQQFAGIEQTVVPGVTRAVGADYASKPLAFSGGSKIPSTYQNGNILGVVTAMFFLISADRVVRGRGTRRDLLIMAGTAVSTILGGSRTALIGLALGLGLLILRSGLRRQTITIIALCVVVAGLTLHLSPALANRLTGTSAADPALAQRTVVWSMVLRSSSVRELLTGGAAWADPPDASGLGEGFIGAMQQVGLVGMGLFLGVFLVVTRPAHLRRWRLLLIPVGVSLAVDSAYLVFPTLFLPIGRMFAPIDSDYDVASEHSPPMARYDDAAAPPR